MNDSRDTIALICRDVNIIERLPLVRTAATFDIIFPPINGVDMLSVSAGALAQIVISPGDLGIGAHEAEIIEKLFAGGLKPIVFLFNPEIEDAEDRASMDSMARLWMETHYSNFEMCSGGQVELNAILDAIAQQREIYAIARETRTAATQLSVRIEDKNRSSAALKTQLADYVNIRLKCDSIIKATQQLEAAVDQAYGEALQRLTESALMLRSRDALNGGLPLKRPEDWGDLVPQLLVDVTTRWQADQIDNMLRDIKRFCPVQVDVHHERVDGVLRLVTDVRPLSGYDVGQGLLRTGGSALLTSTIVATFLTPVAFLALPAALVAGFLMFRKTVHDGEAVARQHFISDLSAHLVETSRDAAMATRGLLKTACDTVKEQVKIEASARVSELLRSDRAISDDEAADISRRLRNLNGPGT